MGAVSATEQSADATFADAVKSVKTEHTFENKRKRKAASPKVNSRELAKRANYIKRRYSEAAQLIAVGASPDAMRLLHDVVTGDVEASVRDRISAASLLLDRAFGKPKQTTEIQGEINITVQHLEAIREVNEAALAQLRKDEVQVIDAVVEGAGSSVDE